MPTIEELNSVWKGRHFTTDLGITITEADADHVVCEMPLTPDHMNILGTPHGGAIFTLADQCASVAANLDQSRGPVMTQSAGIHYLNIAKGTKLIATGRLLKNGRTTTLCRVEITDEFGTPVAVSDQCGFCVGRK